MVFRVIASVLFAVALILPASRVAADDVTQYSPFLEDTYTLWLGGFFPNLDSQIRIDPDVGAPGDGLDFEDTLGLDDAKSVWFGGFRWRPSLRHLVEFEIIRLNRSGQVAGISEPFNIGEYEIRVGGDIESVFDVTIGRFTYGYSIVSNEKTALNLKAGLHIASFEAVLRLSGTVFQDDVVVGDPTTVIEQSAGINAPLPHFGVSYGHAITPRVAVSRQPGVYLERWPASAHGAKVRISDRVRIRD